MKRIVFFLIVLIFLFVLVTALRADATLERTGDGMNWLDFLFAFEIGFIPQGNFVMYDRQPEVFYYEGYYYYPVEVQQISLAQTIYTDLSVEFQFIEIFYIGGSVRIPMIWAGNSFSPHATYYDFQAGARVGPVDIFWNHACRHPQMTYAFNYTTDLGWEGSYDELGIRFKGQLPLIKRKAKP